MTSTHLKLTLRAFALLGAAGGVVALLLSIRGPSSFPELEDLASVTGSVTWTSPDRYSVRFGIDGDSRTFAYAHKSGGHAAVAFSLADTSKQPVTVLVDPSQPQEGSASRPFFQVYEFSTNHALLRPYSEVKDAWASDYRYGYLAALLAFLAAGFLEYVARRVPPNNSFKPMPLRGTA